MAANSFSKRLAMHPAIAQSQLDTMPYEAYPQTDHWLKLRGEAIARADGRCQVCNSTYRLQVHHRTYVRRGNENPGDLTVLCEPCHDLFHRYGKLAGGAE